MDGKLPPGAIIYEGTSLLGPDPIVVIVTFHSKNTKTGDMAQAWVLLRDRYPLDGVLIGEDDSICGDCILRGDGAGNRRACYVNLAHAPTNVYRAYQAGKYPVMTPADVSDTHLRGRMVRLTAYGDPAAVPTAIWLQLLQYAGNWTGYTHQWRRCDPTLRYICMASVDTEEERQDAADADWRTFRTIGKFAPPPHVREEITCPASAEAGHLTTCAACTLCQGVSRVDARSIAIQAHGAIQPVKVLIKQPVFEAFIRPDATCLKTW